MAMEIITTQKGGEALIWQGCKFTLNCKMVNGKKYWRCAKRISTKPGWMCSLDHACETTMPILEGWHNRMKRLARKEHPNLYKAFSERVSCNRSHYTTGGVCKAKRRKVVQWEEKIKLLCSLIPRPFPPPVFDRLQYAKTEGGAGFFLEM